MNKFLFSVLLIQGSLCFGNDQEFFDEIPEQETLQYYAKGLKAAGSIDISPLVNEAVNIAYAALKQPFVQQVNIERQKIAAMGGISSSAYQNVPLYYATPLANCIINQIDVLAQKLTPQQRQQFWNFADGKVKSVIQEFCQGFGVNMTNDVAQNITNQINLKKMFG